MKYSSEPMNSGKQVGPRTLRGLSTWGPVGSRAADEALDLGLVCRLRASSPYAPGTSPKSGLSSPKLRWLSRRTPRFPGGSWVFGWVFWLLQVGGDGCGEEFEGALLGEGG